MSIYAIIGDRGAGKTALMTHLLFQDSEAGIPVVSNYRLYFHHTYMSLKEIAELPESIQDSTIGIDEFQIGADSRSAMSKANMQLTKFVTQLRKRNCVLYFTTQRFNLIDKRIRDQVDYTMMISNVSTKREPDISLLQTFDRWTGEMVGEKVFYLKKAFSLYNTNEIIEFE